MLLELMVFIITNDIIEAMGDLTQYTSIKWPNAFVGYESFEIWAPISKENSEYFKKGNVIWNKSGVAGIIECIKSDVDEDGNKSFDVKGRTLEKYLLDRIVWGTFSYTNKRASTIMYDLVDKNCINPSNPNRKIPWLVNDTDAYIGNLINSYQKTGGWVYDACYSLAVESDIGFTIYPDLKNKRLVFSVREGVDRTINQQVNNPVMFETSLQDILSSSYYTNDEDLKNVAWTQGEDTGVNRKSVIVGESESVGFNRRELHIDARDIQSEILDEETGETIVLTEEEYLQMLRQRGLEKLAEYMTTETFEAQIRQYGEVQYTYGEDFFLGDKVTVKDEELGVMVSARIISVEEDMSDKYELTLNFGYSYPTILDKVKRQTT